jgi:alpha,alpha-trehalase
VVYFRVEGSPFETWSLPASTPLNSDAAERLWKELHSGAESGWDFSSRWFVDGLGNNNGSLKDTRTSLLIPTDLNALLCRNERTLAHFYRTLGEENDLPHIAFD